MSGTISFKEVDELSEAFAAYLLFELKLQKGDRVALQMPNCLAYPTCLFGIIKAGCVVVNVNPLYTESEMEHQFNDSGAKVLVIIDLFADKLTHVIPKTKVQHVLLSSVADLFPLPKKILVKTVLQLKKKVPPVHVQVTRFEKSLLLGAQHMARNGSNCVVESMSHLVTLDDIAALQYTGGTTGVSKGAMLSHRNLISNMMQILAFVKTKVVPGSETILTALPLYHVFAFTANCLSFFYAGGHNVLIPSPRPPSAMRKAFEKYHITWMTGVNTLFNALMNEPWFAQNPPRLKLSVGGGAALHEAVVARWEKMVKSPLIEGFGLTETSPVLTLCPLDGKNSVGTIGIPIPNTSLRIVDESGKCVAVGERGELIAKGPQVMLGYWEKPDETSRVIKEGWFYTGDIATMDEDGYFKIVDRKKDMILVSGFNVYPNEVEDCIAKHPGVLEVAVIGIPDDQSGETVSAYIVLKDSALTAEVVREHCKQLLAAYKVPKKVEFRKDLPKTPIGKILRKDLRAEVLAKKK